MWSLRRNDDNASGVVACGRLVCKAALSDAFEADDDLFYVMLMRWDFGAGLEHVFVCGTLLGAQVFIGQLVADAIGIRGQLA